MSLICALLALAVLLRRFCARGNDSRVLDCCSKTCLRLVFCNRAPCEVVSPFFINGDASSATHFALLRFRRLRAATNVPPPDHVRAAPGGEYFFYFFIFYSSAVSCPVSTLLIFAASTANPPAITSRCTITSDGTFKHTFAKFHRYFTPPEIRLSATCCAA